MKVMRPLRSVGWLGGSGYMVFINEGERRRAKARRRARLARQGAKDVTTYPHCGDCGGKLAFKRETASEPEHYECEGCGLIWKTTTERWKPVLLGRDIKGAAEVQYHQHEETADGLRCSTGECNVPLTEV